MNALITKRLIDLQLKGYYYDFTLSDVNNLICLQTNSDFIKDCVTVRLVEQGYDQLSRNFKYVHTVETSSGEKGILLSDTILLSWISFRKNA